MIDEAFVCDVCGENVAPLGYTARDHCTNCLCSKHVDVNPGDRMNHCNGTLRPVAVQPHKKGIQIVYKCDQCGEIKRNIAARDDNQRKISEVAEQNAFTAPVSAPHTKNRPKPRFPAIIKKGRSPPAE
jgi:hypothetical protein